MIEDNSAKPQRIFKKAGQTHLEKCLELQRWLERCADDHYDAHYRFELLDQDIDGENQTAFGGSICWSLPGCLILRLSNMPHEVAGSKLQPNWVDFNPIFSTKVTTPPLFMPYHNTSILTPSYQRGHNSRFTQPSQMWCHMCDDSIGNTVINNDIVSFSREHDRFNKDVDRDSWSSFRLLMVPLRISSFVSDANT